MHLGSQYSIVIIYGCFLSTTEQAAPRLPESSAMQPSSSLPTWAEGIMVQISSNFTTNLKKCSIRVKLTTLLEYVCTISK